MYEELNRNQKEFFQKLADLCEMYGCNIETISTCYSTLNFQFDEGNIEFDQDSIDHMDIKTFLDE